MKKVLDLDGQEFLDESVSNLLGIDFKDPKVLANVFLNPFGGVSLLNQARKKEEQAKKNLANASQAEKDIMRVQLAQAQDLVAQAEAQLEASKSGTTTSQNPSSAKETTVKSFPWKTVGFVGGGLVVATGLFFLVRHFVKKK